MAKPINPFAPHYKIVTNILLTTDVPEEVNRTWKERFFSLPFKPFKKTKTITKKVPSEEFYFSEDQGIIFCHPEKRQKLEQYLERINADGYPPSFHLPYRF